MFYKSFFSSTAYLSDYKGCYIKVFTFSLVIRLKVKNVITVRPKVTRMRVSKWMLSNGILKYTHKIHPQNPMGTDKTLFFSHLASV